MQSALRLVETWVGQKGLNISQQKTVIVPFTKRRKKEGLGPLILRGATIPLQEEVKYLGVTLDSKLTWNRHVEKTIHKSEITLAVVRRMWKNMGTFTKNDVLVVHQCGEARNNICSLSLVD